ncbi:MAG: hypothetical protein ABWY54_07620 [Glaciihabitans sp.]
MVHIADDEDPYGLPGFPGEEALVSEGWVDHSEIQLRNIRVFTRGPATVTLVQHPGLWDLIFSDGAGLVSYGIPQTDEIADAMRALAAQA